MTAGPHPVSPALNGWNAEYLDAEQARWRADPSSVSPELRAFFEGFDLGAGRGAAVAGGPAGQGAPGGPGRSAGVDGGEMRLRYAMRDFIEAHRRLGHLAARIDPFGRPREGHPTLEPAASGITEADMETLVDAGRFSPDGSPMTVRALIEAVRATYCGSIGVEMAHITADAERQWLMERLERTHARPQLTRNQRARVLTQLHKAEMFEKFCGKRFPGVKRFSLEGGESTIPFLERVIERSAERDIGEIVMGMAHRGRLNVLTNIVGKTYEEIFTEFEDAWSVDAANGGGDVKYHRGYSSNRVVADGKTIHLVMASNPSHLESVNPVVLGRVRAKQRQMRDYERSRVMAVLLHGDAAMIGQGVVPETFNLGQLEGYWVGGTVHLVINNLIGFTTGEEDARSTRYCTDSAKIVEVPILHVNGEDPEACVLAAELAVDYRMTFRKDVVVDLTCYRWHGHNETDEAMFTQPLLYKNIRARDSVLTSYARRLHDERVITDEEVEAIRSSLSETLDRAYMNAKQTPVDPTPDPGTQRWEGIHGRFSFDAVETGVSRETLARVAAALGRWPEGFTPHPKLVTTLRNRAECVEKDLPIDWGTAENLAVGSLLAEGRVVRLTGQDCRRGTFSHRHAGLRDAVTGDLFVPLSHLDEPLGPQTIKRAGARDAAARNLEGRYWVYDSPLSEFAVMGFEYGYSLTAPDMLVMWEAQFGDFCNGAQTIIDQYIASGEVKWQRWSGLVLLLPHGYEGQGPEHSSARLERFLQLCGDENMQVCMPTTPAQYFHMLRRQVHPERRFRKPLIVMTPKSLLRLPAAASRVAELASGSFREILDDPMFEAAAPGSALRRGVRRVVLCSGKVYYDLVERRRQLGLSDRAFVRVEQLYPLHSEMLREVLAGYPSDAEVVWVQEEPENMGAYVHMRTCFLELFARDLGYIGRPASATPATGSPSKSAEQLEEFLTDAVGEAAVHVAAAHGPSTEPGRLGPTVD
ncbi:MAG: 2-oxoglutarate dehydrogenase E1 component [Planctomycetota bacterium]|nr:2-oxoglutarate dehydrogenase E1 component [Planctomycetota bacterium]